MSESLSGTDDGAATAGALLSTTRPSPFVNRDEERARCRSLIRAASTGDGQFLLISGEPGIGRTRLAQEIAEEARAAGFHLGIGQCDELGRMLPHYPLLQALSALYLAVAPSVRDSVAQRWPEVWGFVTRDALATASLRPPADEERFVEEVVAFVRAVAEDAPTGLVLDDLHLADDYTLTALASLALRTRHARVLVVGTYRKESGGACSDRLQTLLRRVDRERPVQYLQLQPFSASNTADLMTCLMEEGEASPQFVEFVHSKTRGNPGAVNGMIRSLGGRLALVREIGTGGMARVFRAHDSVSGKEVAAKIMFAQGDVDVEALVRFQQEGAVLSTFEHPNIVTVYGSFLDETVSCIIMELLEGCSLGDLFHSERVSLPRARMLLQQVAAALAYAHDRGIVHRDVKPENIMVLAGEHVKVTDFGIAHVQRPEEAVSITMAGRTLGTPLYMAPEQIEGRPVDGRADVYSFGAVMYQIGTGRPPFDGDNPLTVAYKHIHENPVPPRHINPSLPADWERVIMRCLAKDPADRFQTARELEATIAHLSPSPRSTTAAAGSRSARPVSDPRVSDDEGPDPRKPSYATKADKSPEGTSIDAERGARRPVPWRALALGVAVLLVLLIVALVFVLR